MATITTSVGGQQLLAEINGSTDLDGYAIDAAYIFDRASSSIFGVASSAGAIDFVSGSFDGIRESSFSDIFYNRIWIIEKHTDLGNITQAQTRTIEVWNAFFETQTLTDFTFDSDIVVTGLASGDFAPLHSEIYSVFIPISGSPNIAASITWDFDPAGAFVGTVAGQRIIPFTLRHNWTEKVLEQVTFLTDVLGALSGKEQRIGIRRLPRRRFEMSYMTLTPLERSYLENVTFGWQGRKYAVPLWSDVTSLRSPVSEGDSVFDVDTFTRDFDIGAFLFITDGEKYDTLEISGVTADSVTTATPSANSYGLGARVVPARLGTLDSKIDFARVTNQIDTTTLAWSLTADQESVNRLDSYEPETYRGSELYNVSNDYTNTINVEQNFRTDVMDANNGAFGIYPSDPFPRRTYPFSSLLIRSELGRFLQFMYNRLGRLNPFWFVERVPSFFLQTSVLADDLTLVVTTGGYTLQSFDSPSRRDIAILTTAGWKYRRITGSVLNDDGTETITIDSNLGVAVDASTDPMISYLKFVRLDQDLFELSYTSTGAISTATAFTDLLTN